MNRKTMALVCLVAMMALLACGCGSSSYGDAYKEAQKQVEEEAARIQEEINAQIDGMAKGTAGEQTGSEAPDVEPDESETPDVKQDAPKDAPEETPAQAEDEPEAPGTGSYEVDGISVYYNASVNNDKTGNWRLAVISDGSELNDYVVDFYKKFVTNDSEVFGIVNLGLRTVTRVSHVMEDWLDVRVMEYRDGEEHDAVKLYGGDTLKHYWINSETGEIDEDLD